MYESLHVAVKMYINYSFLHLCYLYLIIYFVVHVNVTHGDIDAMMSQAKLKGTLS